MEKNHKIRVAVLFGGRSAEHEVSLQSAANVLENLDKTLFEAVPIGIDKKGNWLLGQEIFDKSLLANKVKADHELTWFNPEWVSKSIENNAVVLNKQNTSIANAHSFDVVFPVVHGSLCEDGTLQGLLELANLPYVGCGVLASAIGMDKDVAKRLAIQAGIPVAPYIALKKEQWLKNSLQCKTLIHEKIAYPLFVKPANAGSSVGISKVKQETALTKAMEEAFKWDNKVLIEKALTVSELEVAVLQSLESENDPIVSEVGEIVTGQNHEFYSYDAKYNDDKGAELIIPAHIDETTKGEAQRLAKQLFLIFECQGMARVDLFLTKDTHQLYFNEINTIPGFTKISMYPKLMHASGFSYTKLLTHLIQLAMIAFDNKNTLQRTVE